MSIIRLEQVGERSRGYGPRCSFQGINGNRSRALDTAWNCTQLSTPQEEDSPPTSTLQLSITGAERELPLAMSVWWCSEALWTSSLRLQGATHMVTASLQPLMSFWMYSPSQSLQQHFCMEDASQNHISAATEEILKLWPVLSPFPPKFSSFSAKYWWHCSGLESHMQPELRKHYKSICSNIYSGIFHATPTMDFSLLRT